MPVKEISKGKWLVRVSQGPTSDGCGGIRYPEVSRTVLGTKRDALRKEAELRIQFGRADDRVMSAVTVDELLNQWLKAEVQTFTAATYANYEYWVNRLVRPHLGQVELGKLERRRVQRWVDTLEAEGVGKTTIHRARSALRSSLSWAERRELIAKNPARDLDMPTERVDRRYTPSKEEVMRLLRAADDEWPTLGLLATIAANTGMRRGELVGLQWSDIDWKRQELTVNRSVVVVGGRKSVKDPKTHQVRVVPIPSPLLDRLRSLHAERAHQSAEAGVPLGPWIISENLGADYVRPDRLGKAWHKVAKREGLSQVVLHGLRHFYGTAAIDNGMSAPSVAANLGHSSPITTMRFYAAPTDDGRRRVANVIGDLLQPDGSAETAPN